MPKDSVGARLEEAAKARRSKERFLKTRMWISTLSSFFFQDRATIPENIGNNVFVGNNQIITKNSITTAIMIEEFSLETLIAFSSHIIAETKAAVKGVLIDTYFINRRNNVDTNDSGMKNRKSQWEKTLQNSSSSSKSKTRAARLIYSFERAAGVGAKKDTLFRSKIYIVIRAKNGTTSRAATEEVKDYLESYGILYKEIKSDIQTHAEIFSLMQRKNIKGIGSDNIMSARTLAESLPDTHGYNDLGGNFLGLTVPTRSPYYINFKGSAKGKNILLVGPTGMGKTVLAEYWGIDAFTIDFCPALMDMKGGEYDVFMDAIGGMKLSMSSDSTHFVNTYRWEPDSVENGEYEIYAKERKNLTIERLCILAKPKPENEGRVRQIMESFLGSLYLLKGVLESNPNTWYRTNVMHPYNVYESFKDFVSTELKDKYSDIIEDVIDNLFMTMDRKGSYSHIFRDEYLYSDLMESRGIVYNFAALSGTGIKDPSIFKLKLQDMDIINNDYARYKKNQGKWVFKILEESQYAADFIMDMYVKELTLRRSQNQVTVMLTNSIQALIDNPKAKAAMDNINMICVGGLAETARELIIKEFSLEEHRETLFDLYDNAEYEHVFFMSNRMTKDSVSALLKAEMPDKVINGPLFKVVDKEEREEW